MPVEANVFNVGACIFGMMMGADFLVFLGRDCLGKMVGAKAVMELVVREAVKVV